MSTLSDDFDFSLLSGCYLEMVCFGVRITRFDFSRPQTFAGVPPYKISFCVEAGLKYEIDDIVGQREFNDSSTSAPLLDFLLMDVESVVEVEPDTLQIIFSTGAKITIKPDVADGYESYSIYLDSGDVIVV
ncbi:hypothetical protein [Pseudomonas sp. B14(2022)]|uniref:hypothetical protein n=1 Tax=Pseudomonas sp. B14(2022) TaxID=2914043 RepID=UPI00143216F3|nr:hypothetical protein [Pseudomonas sp. B14(2022)]NJJ58395.1 hypothetical protein [Pseudomonas sp. B14(2022)]